MGVHYASTDETAAGHSNSATFSAQSRSTKPAPPRTSYIVCGHGSKGDAHCSTEKSVENSMLCTTVVFSEVFIEEKSGVYGGVI